MFTTKEFYHPNFCHLSAASFAVLLKHMHSWLLLLVSLLTERQRIGKGTVCMVDKSPELTAADIAVLLECVQAGILPSTECQLRVCVICEGGFSGRTGFCQPYFEIFWILWRRGKKEAISCHKNWQYMTHPKSKKIK